jgi:hypothetical protein
MMEKLRECPNPWCVFKDSARVVLSWCHLDCGYAVRCDCGIIGPQADIEAAAISAWNTRPGDQAAEAMAKALKEVLADHDERNAIWSGTEDQPHRVKVIEQARAALHAYEEAKK